MFLGVPAYLCVPLCVCVELACVCTAGCVWVSSVSIFASVRMHLTASGSVHLCGHSWVPGYGPKGLMGKVPLGPGIAASVLMLPDL